jgi:hypothetical protein
MKYNTTSRVNCDRSRSKIKHNRTLCVELEKKSEMFFKMVKAPGKYFIKNYNSYVSV